jgi:hypothetical protein
MAWLVLINHQTQALAKMLKQTLTQKQLRKWGRVKAIIRVLARFARRRKPFPTQ